MIIFFNEVQLLKAEPPIFVTLLGSVISSNDAQPLKAESPTVVIPAPIYTSLRFLQS